MAFVTTETSVTELAGSPRPKLLVCGTYTSSAGGTGGVLAPGYTNSSGTFTAISGAQSVDGRKILSTWITPLTSTATQPGGVVSYNSTLDSDVFTVVTTADTAGKYMLLCTDAGA
jgi:hypothetical protein